MGTDVNNICQASLGKALNRPEAVRLKADEVRALDDLDQLLEIFQELYNIDLKNKLPQSKVDAYKKGNRCIKQNSPCKQDYVLDIMITILNDAYKDTSLSDAEFDDLADLLTQLRKLRNDSYLPAFAFNNPGVMPETRDKYLKYEADEKLETDSNKRNKLYLKNRILKALAKVIGEKASEKKFPDETSAALKKFQSTSNALDKLSGEKVNTALTAVIKAVKKAKKETCAPGFVEEVPASVPATLPATLPFPQTQPASLTIEKVELKKPEEKGETTSIWERLFGKPKDHIFSFNARGKIGLAERGDRIPGRGRAGLTLLSEEERGLLLGGGFSARLKLDHFAIRTDYDTSFPLDLVFGDKLISHNDYIRGAVSWEYDRVRMLALGGLRYYGNDYSTVDNPNSLSFTARTRTSFSPIKNSFPIKTKFGSEIPYELSLFVDGQMTAGLTSTSGTLDPTNNDGVSAWQAYINQGRLQSLTFEPGISSRFGPFKQFIGINHDWESGFIGPFFGGDWDFKIVEIGGRAQQSRLTGWEVLSRIFIGYGGNGIGTSAYYNNNLAGRQQVKGRIFGRFGINVLPSSLFSQNIGIQPFCDAAFERNNANALNVGCGVWFWGGNAYPLEFDPFSPDSNAPALPNSFLPARGIR